MYVAPFFVIMEQSGTGYAGEYADRLYTKEKGMYSVYESINYNSNLLVNAFVAPIESSTFHWHNEYELLGVLRGSIISHIQSEECLLRQGDMLLVNPDEIHALQNAQKNENLCMVLQIKPTLFHMNPKENAEIHFYMNSVMEDAPVVGYPYFFRRMARIVYETLSEEKNARFRARAELCGLIADLFDYAIYDVRYRDRASEDGRETVIQALSYIEELLVENELPEVLCHKLGMSRKTLDRNSRAVLGMTIKEVIDNHRVEKAKELLKHTNKTISFIMDACGFGSEKSFYRIFHQKTGQTPKDFREKGQHQSHDDVLKGYLDFSIPEARAILREVIGKHE